MTPERRALFNTRLLEGYDVSNDELYSVWKGLKQQHHPHQPVDEALQADVPDAEAADTML